MKIKKKVLENGLTILLYPDSKKHSAYVNLITKFGGETEGFTWRKEEYTLRNGMAHLLEHLLIETSSYGNLVYTFGQMNISHNGLTTLKKTEFYFNGVENIYEGVKILLKGINDASFTEEDVLKVKDSIYEEIRMNADSKGSKLFQLQNKALFQKIAYHNTLGTIEDVESFTYEEVKRCYDAFYNFSNQYLVVAGNYEEDLLLETIENVCKTIQKTDDLVQTSRPVEPKQVKEKRLVEKMPTEKPIVQISYKIPIKEYDSAQKHVLDFYLGYFMDINLSSLSKVVEELEEKNIITGILSYYDLFFKDYVILTVIGTTEDELLFIKEINKVFQNPIWDKKLFNELKQEKKVYIALREEQVEKYVDPFVDNIFDFDFPYEDSVEHIESHTFEDYKEKIEALDFSNYSICKIEDLEEKGV